MIGRPADFFRRLLKWYDRARRDLPWRTSRSRPGPLDPYHVLLSEMMLQQTQVATVVPYFHRFLKRFPTLDKLAAGPEQDVLRLWQGLGYYSRARNLLAAAKKVVSEFNGSLPSGLQDLLSLPGVGRYTAGAIASIAFDQPAPIVDGNVTRVICRLDGIQTNPREKATRQLLWQRATDMVPNRRPGDFNSAMMELGATVCSPRNPQCLICPVQAHCQAAAAGLQDKIPAPKKARPTPLVHRRTYCIRNADKWLIEQRPTTGRWASMWQFITIDASLSQQLPVKTRRPVNIGKVCHALTHRRYEFEVFTADAVGSATPFDPARQAWVSIQDMDRYPLPRPHLKMLEMLKSKQKPSEF